ncbi:MAG: hypothetical protein KUG78_00185 [Kangiellaceae bacterium]|nr:hypothetical protein [Kangiellaceae bacterium]
MKLVFLPGMDGTGRLFQPLLSELPLSLSSQVITLSSNKKQSYSELVEEIKPQLPKEAFILLAESFSGVVAFELSLDTKIPIKKVVLVASFLVSPRPKLSWIANKLPISILFSIPLPSRFYRIFCFNNSANKILVEQLKRSLQFVEKSVLCHRLRMILELEKPTRVSKVSSLIICPTNDKLIPSTISSVIAQSFETSKVVEVDGPHFLAQVCPKEIARLVVIANDEV